MATHSSVLAWMIPWTQELSGLQSIGLQRVGHDWSDLTHTARQSILGTIRLARHNNFFMWEGTFMWSEVKVKVTQSCPWNSPGQNAGVGSLSLLQGSSQTRDWTQVSGIVRGFFTNWAFREALHLCKKFMILARTIRILSAFLAK